MEVNGATGTLLEQLTQTCNGEDDCKQAPPMKTDSTAACRKNKVRQMGRNADPKVGAGVGPTRNL
jgi:hypothetical protein